MFVQVYNNTSAPHRGRDDLTISDTQGNVYTPIVPGRDQPRSPTAAGPCPPKGRLPAPDTIAANGPTQGALLLSRSRSSRSTTGRSS